MSCFQRKWGIVFALLLVFLTGCQNSSDLGASDSISTTSNKSCYYTFTDSTGKEITLQQKPKNVAILFSSYADIWKTAGGDIQITVGESIERGFAPSNALLVDDDSGIQVDVERLLSYKPDFVIGSADFSAQVDAAEILNQAGIPTALFQVESFEQYLSMLKICTDITQNEEAYETYGTKVQEQINDLFEQIESLNQSEKTKILFVRAGSSDKYTKAKTAKDNFVCVMLQELGTYNIAENAKILLDGLSFEEVLTENPSYIFFTTMGSEEAAKAYVESFLQEETWQGLQAVKNDQCFFLPKDLFHFKPNARWAEAYEYLANLLYPQLKGE